MGVEPERKFLLKNDGWMRDVSGKSHITQAYIKDSGADVSIHMGSDAATIAITGKADSSVTHMLDIPLEDAQEILALFGKRPPTLRIRLMDDAEGFITIKGKRPEGSIETPEFEYEISAKDAKKLLALCAPGRIEKMRHYVEYAGNTWEVDIFEGSNQGLIVAEIELPHGNSAFEKPSWVGDEITFDGRYTNANLSANPYCNWSSPPSPGKSKPAQGPAG